MLQKIILIYDLLRVKQWVKNAFIFFPLLFSGQLFHGGGFLNCVIAFAGFSLLCSGGYVLNDFLDREQDKKHPLKAQRVIARHDVSAALIFSLAGLLALSGSGICFLADPGTLIPIGIYCLLYFFYNFLIKRVVILDAFFVAFGFQIRVWLGAFAAEVYPSLWLQFCVFLLALFLGFAKRRDELGLLKDQAGQHRGVLAEYSLYFLDQILLICSTLAIVFYGLYTISPEVAARPGGHFMPYTVVFVIYGIFRYLYLVHIHNRGGDPGEILVTDRPLLLNVICWVGVCGWIVYGLK
ncbi:MAG: UbiA prenyltransferase family protein [Candidatus Omnitrophica bacterium]|nr:UbiA prenyltransferase family protein [Candidatus Omnitrophota bacterium]